MNPRARAATATLVLAAFLAWRAMACPVEVLWRDVPAVAAVCAIWTAWRPVGQVGVAASAYLLGLYLSAQGPRVLEVLGLR